MTTTDWTQARPIPTSELPAWLTTYLDAHSRRDLDAAMASYDEASIVTDEGRSYAGTAAIRAWMGNAATEYTYTREITGAYRLDATHYDVTDHLEGDFPGGVADLHFRFSLRGETIAELVIEP